MRTHSGKASSFDSSLRMRLLNPFGPDAFPVGSDFRTDLTSKGVRMIEFKVDSILYGGKAGSSA